MSLVVVLVSIGLRIAGLVWSLVLLRRFRDWRLGLLSAVLALMALRQALTLATEREHWTAFPPGALTELPSLLVSVGMLAAVVFIGRMIADYRGAIRAASASADEFEDRERKLRWVVTQAPLVLWSLDAEGTFDLSEGRGEEAHDMALERWVRALDLRDHETEGHTQRVTRFTVELGRKLGIPEKDLVHLRRGALLHDIGKIGISDTVLCKPGPLSGEEWGTMKRHPEYARRMLSDIPFLRPALEIPYCHHERWDGSGYPRELSGQEIPLSARVFAVVDVWDALLSDRPYRDAWPEEEVLAYLAREAGGHFDPEVVTAFLQLLQEEGTSG
jgi:HD-GYP domain-containing protein (c-di-GMP phosphodiesterase class II)